MYAQCYALLTSEWNVLQKVDKLDQRETIDRAMR